MRETKNKEDFLLDSRLPTIKVPHISQIEEENPLKLKNGHWSRKEQLKYFAFLSKNSEIFESEESRREFKVFKNMAIFIKTRDSHQCRSHHHKMNRKGKNIHETLSFLKENDPSLVEQSKKYCDQLDSINFSKEENYFPVNIESKSCFKKSWDIEENSFRENVHDLSKNTIEIPKSVDIGSLRTDSSDKNIECGLKNIKFNEKKSEHKKIEFPSTGIINEYHFNFNSKGINMFGDNFSTERSDVRIFTRKELLFLECHQIFIKWLYKMEELY